MEHILILTPYTEMDCRGNDWEEWRVRCSCGYESDGHSTRLSADAFGKKHLIEVSQTEQERLL